MKKNFIRRLVFHALNSPVLRNLISDRLYLRIRYRYYTGKRLNLEHPCRYNEKLQWLKLYYRNHQIPRLTDKYEVRGYIEETLGNEYLIPLLGVWDSFDEIDFTSLPDQFVLKCTHDSNSVIICRNKADWNREKAHKKLTKALNRSFYWGGREWPYKELKPRIIAEQYMSDDSGTGLKDYKFFCFQGVVKAFFIATDRGVAGEEVKFDFFDEHFNHLPFMHGHPNAEMTPTCAPSVLKEMMELASKLSAGMPHVRVDLYHINGRIYFGEFTFFHHSGIVPFIPDTWDLTFGSWLQLPEQKE